MPQPGQTPYGVPSSTYSQTPSTAPTTGGKGGVGQWVWNFAKGVWEFVKNNPGDVIGAATGLIEGYMSSEDRQKQLDEIKRQYDLSLKQRQAEQATGVEQFDRTTGNSEAQQAVQAQTQLNRAPLADKAQALLLARMGVAPGQFQGRDYTKGTADLLRTPMTPGANVASTMQTAAQNYRPGQGGVDTSTLSWLLNRMRTSADRSAVGTKPPTVTPPEPPAPPRPKIRDLIRPPGSEFPGLPPTTSPPRPPREEAPPPPDPSDPEIPDDDENTTGFRRRGGY